MRLPMCSSRESAWLVPLTYCVTRWPDPRSAEMAGSIRTMTMKVRFASIHEAVQLRGVVADDLLADIGRQVPQLLLDVLLRVRVDAVRVREVGAPHDVV